MKDEVKREAEWQTQRDVEIIESYNKLMADKPRAKKAMTAIDEKIKQYQEMLKK